MFSSISESEKLWRGEEVGMVLLDGEFEGDGDADLKNKVLIFKSFLYFQILWFKLGFGGVRA